MKHRCIDCRFCDTENLTCYPESKDCNQSYELDETDLYSEGCCDFFSPIKKKGVDGNPALSEGNAND